jgi:hypothetical protein
VTVQEADLVAPHASWLQQRTKIAKAGRGGHVLAYEGTVSEYVAKIAAV